MFAHKPIRFKENALHRTETGLLEHRALFPLIDQSKKKTHTLLGVMSTLYCMKRREQKELGPALSALSTKTSIFRVILNFVVLICLVFKEEIKKIWIHIEQ